MQQIPQAEWSLIYSDMNVSKWTNHPQPKLWSGINQCIRKMGIHVDI